MDIKQQSLDFLNFLCKIFDTDIEKKCKSDVKHYSVTLGQYVIDHELFDIYKAWQEGNYEIAYELSYDCMVDAFKNGAKIKNATPEELRQYADIFNEAAEHVTKYTAFTIQQKEQFRKYIFSMPLLKEEEKTDSLIEKFNNKWINSAKIALEKYIKTYSYTEEHEFPNIFDYRISNNIIITSDTRRFLQSIKPTDDDIINVYVMMKIEDIIDYSYFIFAFQYHNSIYIATDKLDFSNPRTASTRRNPARHRESFWNNVSLPYGLIDDVLHWRKENKYLSKTDEDIEMYTQSILDIGSGDKICIHLLINECIRNISLNHNMLKKISYSVDIVKLLPSSITNDENSFCKINYDKCKEYFDDLFIPTSTLPTLTTQEANQQLIKSCGNDWLMTHEAAISLREWLIAEKQRENIQNIFNETANPKQLRNDENTLKEMLLSNIESILSIATSGDMVYSECLDNKFIASHNYNSPTRIVFPIFCNSLNSKFAYTSFTLNSNYKNDLKFKCVISGARTNTGLTIRIYSWRQLCALVGCKRIDLPPVYRNYNWHNAIPYYGNSILDNVDPRFLITDYMSNHQPNGISIFIPLARTEITKLRKKNRMFENSVALLSYALGDVVNITSKEDVINSSFNTNTIVDFCQFL